MKTPLIGIFWIIENNKFILDTCPFGEGEDIVGDWINHSGHHPFWERYSKEHYIPYDYTHYPRGRVIYNKKTKKFKIVSSKGVIKDMNIVKKLARAFNLTEYVLSSDAHYEKAFELLE